MANGAPLRPTLPETNLIQVHVQMRVRVQIQSKAWPNARPIEAERPGPKESISNGWPYAGALCRMINGVKMPM